VKIAFLSNYTADFVVKELGKRLLDDSIRHEFYVPGFNQYTQEILDSGSRFYGIAPDVAIISVDMNILCGDILAQLFVLPREEVISRIESRYQDLKSQLRILRGRLPSLPLLVDSCFFESRYSSGTLERNSRFTVSSVPDRINSDLEEFAKDLGSTVVVDINTLAQKYGEKLLFDRRLWYIAKSRWSRTGAEKLSQLYVNHIKAYRGMRKKCIVLDLDNTLWGGIVGQDGKENLQLSNDGPGKAYYDLQEELLKMHQKGILLSICSKNSEDAALDAIANHPFMLLRPEHFACIRINWESKDKNIVAMAGELNIGLESFVFLDDSKFERELVRTQLPDVTVPEMPDDPADLVEFMKDLDQECFAFHSITEEDLKRNRDYQANKERVKLAESLPDLDSYFRSLSMIATIKEVDDFSFPRVVQLIQKTNQFNLTTRRYTEAELKDLRSNPTCHILELSLRDKFGDNGIVGVAILTTVEKKAIHIDTFLLSCRVIGRTVETAFLSYIAEWAAKNDAETIQGEFIPTAKNQSCQDFYRNHGFTPQDDGVWKLKLEEGTVPAPDWIKIIGG
jgi:FkbH-like protein